MSFQGIYFLLQETKSMFKDLDPVLHSQVRLAIMSLLIGMESAEFSYLLINVRTSKGNLSFQLSKLREANYINIVKSFRGSYPLTTINISDQGIKAYEQYVEQLEGYLIHFSKRTKSE